MIAPRSLAGKRPWCRLRFQFSRAPRHASPTTSASLGATQTQRFLLRRRLRLRIIPESTQAAATACGRLLLSGLSPERRDKRRRGLLRCLWVRRQPGRERPALFDVVGAQHAGDVRVVFSVAVAFAVEEVTAERVVARGGGCEEVGEVPGHGGGASPRFGGRMRYRSSAAVSGLLWRESELGLWWMQRWWGVAEMKGESVLAVGKREPLHYPCQLNTMPSFRYASCLCQR